MKADNRESLLFWGVIVLAVLNLSIIATLIYQKYISQPDTENLTNNYEDMQDRNVRFSGRYFKENLLLTPDQISQFQNFNPAFRNNAMEINTELARLRREMLKEMSGSDPDTSRLNQLSDSIGFLHSQLKKLTYRYYLDFKAICRPDQYPLLEQMFDETFSNDQVSGQGNRMRQRGRNRYRGGRY